MADLTTTAQLQNLLDRLAKGDPTAKADLIDRAYERLIIVARKLLNGFMRVRAEEETAGILSEAYLRLHAALDEVKPTSVRQFVGLAALEIRRVLLDRIRKMEGRGKESRPQKQSLDAGSEGGAPGPAIADDDFNEERRTLALDLLEAVGHLPVDEREAVELLFFQGYSQPEAGEILGVHEDTVKRRWSRARVKLAEQLSAFGAA